MIYSFLYVLVNSCAAVLIQKLYYSISPLFSLLVTATIATVFFNLLNIHSLKKMYSACWKEKRLWFGVMVTILVMWNCSMIGPGLIGAALYNFLYFAFVGMLGFMSLALKDFEKNRIKLYFGLCILLLLIIVIGSEFYYFSTKTTLIGILLGLIGGAVTFLYFKQSQAITKRMHLTPTQILAVRFYLTIIVTFVILPHGSFIQYSTVNNFSHLLLLAALSLIIPLFFQQKGLEKISSEQYSIIVSLCPVVSAILQELVFKDVHLAYVIVYLAYSFIIFLSYLLGKTRKGVATS